MSLQIQNTPVCFKADNSNISYNTRKTKPMPSNPMNDLYMQMAVEQQKAEKREKSCDRWNKAGVVFNGVNGFAFLTLAGIAVLGFLGLKKGGKGAKSAAEQELERLTGVRPKWEDFATTKSVASLDSKTTSKSLQEAFNNIISGSKLSEKARKWGGLGEKQIDIMYLYGHGGVGKTYVAKQYAQEIGAMFTCIKYPDLGSPYKDAASMRISNLFDELVKKATELKDRKIVVCIDEIDAVMRKVPDGNQGAEEIAKSRAALLTGIDKLREKCSNVTVVATSNYHPKNGIIDPIALRRFNNKIEVPLPNKEQIEALLEMYLKDIGAVTESDFIKTSAFKNFAKKLEKGGYSNGEIELIAKESAKIFSGTLKGVSDDGLKSHKFTVKYLEDALKMNGEAASKTNKLMDVKKGKEKPEGKTVDDLGAFQRLLLKLFFRGN